MKLHLDIKQGSHVLWLAVIALALLLGVIAGAGMGMPLAVAGGLLLAVATGFGPLTLVIFPPAVTFWVPLLEVGTSTFTLGDGVLALAVVAAGLRMLSRRSFRFGLACRAVIWTGLYALVVLLGSASVGQPLVTNLMTTLKRLAEFAVLIPVAIVILRRRHVPWIAAAMALSSIVVAVLSVLEYQKTGNRTGGPLFYANVLGLYAATLWNLSFALVTERRVSSWLRWIGGVAVLANLVTLVVSASRSAMLGLLVAAAWWMFRFRWSLWAKVRTVVLGAIVLAVVISSDAGQNALARWADVSEHGTDTMQVAARLEAQDISLRVFAEHPLVGVGITGLPEASLWLVTTHSRAVGVETVNNSGSQWAQLLAETGVIGFALVALLLYEFYKLGTLPGRRPASLESPEATIMGNALSASVMTCIGAGIGMHTIIVPYVAATLWLQAACVNALMDPALQSTDADAVSPREVIG